MEKKLDFQNEMLEKIWSKLERMEIDGK
jgi:hypothetical protein